MSPAILREFMPSRFHAADVNIRVLRVEEDMTSAFSRLELIRHFLNNSSESWKIRSTTTAAKPIATTVNTSTLSLRTTALFLAARHTIGRLTAALDKEARTVVLPA